MLKRGGKSSDNPYSTTQRVKKPEWKDKLDILPNRHSLWLKQVGEMVQMFLSLLKLRGPKPEAVVRQFFLLRRTQPEVLLKDHDTTGDLVKAFKLSNFVDVLAEGKGHARARVLWHHPSPAAEA